MLSKLLCPNSFCFYKLQEIVIYPYRWNLKRRKETVRLDVCPTYLPSYVPTYPSTNLSQCTASCCFLWWDDLNKQISEKQKEVQNHSRRSSHKMWHFASLRIKNKRIVIRATFSKMSQTRPLVVYFRYFRMTNIAQMTINDKSVDGVLVTRTWAGSIVGANKFFELWRHPSGKIHLDSGCSTVGREAASYTRGPRVESSLQWLSF